MLDFETCKRLMEAGFPLKLTPYRQIPLVVFGKTGDGLNIYNDGYLHRYVEFGNEEVYWLPTLSELISACGEPFEALERINEGEWFAASDTDGPYKKASTPEKAVANLYLSLNQIK